VDDANDEDYEDEGEEDLPESMAGWHWAVIMFRSVLEDDLNVSFARYLLVRLLEQEREVFRKMVAGVKRGLTRDGRQGSRRLGKQRCKLYGDVVSRRRTTVRCTFRFQDALPPYMIYQNKEETKMRFAFTVNHVMWLWKNRHGTRIPIAKDQIMIHACHLRCCCNTNHYFWGDADENRSRDVCRIRGFSFLMLPPPTGTTLCFCPHRPCCLIVRKCSDMTQLPPCNSWAETRLLVQQRDL
jgi:hypothetical protein